MPRTQVVVRYGDVLTNLKRASDNLREIIAKVLDEGGAAIIDDARSFAPNRRGRLASSLAYRAEVLKTTGKIVLLTTNKKVSEYWMAREFGPSGGTIEAGEHNLAFAPEDSPFFGTDTHASTVISNPSRFGFQEVFKIPGIDVIFGSRARRSYKKGAKREGGIVLFVTKDSVEQEQFPDGRYLFRAVREHTDDIVSALGAAIAAEMGGEE